MFTIGDRIEIPVHYDRWAQGARYGVITSYRNGRNGYSAYFNVKLDRLPTKRLKLWKLDWEYAKIV